MGIDTVRCAGKQCYLIFSFLNLQCVLECLMIILFYHIENLIHLIGKCLIQHMDVKHISLLHLIDIGK